MTTQELIDQLTQVVKAQPWKAEVNVYVYIGDIEELPDGAEEVPLKIQFIDDSISDRVDINI